MAIRQDVSRALLETIKTDEQLDKMNRAEFNHHRDYISIQVLKGYGGEELNEYQHFLSRYVLNRWFKC